MLKPHDNNKSREAASMSAELEENFLGKNYVFIPYEGEQLTKPDASFAFMGWCHTPLGTKLVIQKSSSSKMRFDITKDDAFMGDPTWVIDLLGGREQAFFWGFEYIGADVLLLPGSQVINAAIETYNSQIANCIDDHVGVIFYTPIIDLVPADAYARDYVDHAKLPLASVSVNNQPNLREAIHDVSYHLSSLLMPNRVHELLRARLQIITNFLIDAQQRPLNEFAHYRTKLGDTKEGTSSLRQDVVRTMENSTALVTLAWHSAIPQELKLWDTKSYAVSSALGLATDPLDSIYPKTKEEIHQLYRFLDTMFPGTIDQAIPFFESFHDYLSRFSKELCTLSLYQQMNLASSDACAKLIGDSIDTKITGVRSYLRDKK